MHPADMEKAARSVEAVRAARASFLAWFGEVVADAAGRPDRLSPWERGFIETMADKAKREGIFLKPSDKQNDALRRIETKIYES